MNNGLKDQMELFQALKNPVKIFHSIIVYPYAVNNGSMYWNDRTQYIPDSLVSGIFRSTLVGHE